MNKRCSILNALSGITKQWARRGMLLSCRWGNESSGRSKNGISLPRYQAISCSVQNECYKLYVVGLICVCVCVCVGDWLCYDTCTLTSVDRRGYQVTARRRCGGSNTLTLPYPGGFGYTSRLYS